MPRIAVQNQIPQFHRAGRKKARKPVRDEIVNGMRLCRDGSIAAKNKAFPDGDYVNARTEQTECWVTSLGDKRVVFYKKKDGTREGYIHDKKRQHWERCKVPTCGPLPKRTLFDRIRCGLGRRIAEWIVISRLPKFLDDLQFDDQRGRISYLDSQGQRAWFSVSGGGPDSVEFTSRHVKGDWKLVRVSQTRVNVIDLTQGNFGQITRLAWEHKRWLWHVLLEPVSVDGVADFGLIYREDGKIIVADGAVPLVLDVFKPWRLWLSDKANLRSFGDGFLLHVDDTPEANLTEYYCGGYGRQSFYRIADGVRQFDCPFVLNGENTLSVSVCKGSVTLFDDGTAEVLGKMISRNQVVDYHVGDIHVFREPGDEWLYLVENGFIQGGVYNPSAFSNENGTFPGWQWGGERELPCSDGFPKWFLFFPFFAVWFLSGVLHGRIGDTVGMTLLAIGFFFAYYCIVPAFNLLGYSTVVFVRAFHAVLAFITNKFRF